MSEHITAKLLAMVAHAVAKHLPEDHAEYDVCFYPLPDDTGWMPSMLIYVQLTPVGEVDGWHKGEFVSPYAVSQEWVDYLVHEMAKETEKLRQELRQARAEGKQVRVGLAAEAATG
jgi:hypothetical protein